MKRRIICIVALMVFVAGMAEAKTYKIGMNPWIASSPLNVADAKGFWDAQGLDVEVVNFGNDHEKSNAFINKRVDLAIGMLGLWVGLYTEGTPVVILAEVDWSHGGDKIIVKKGESDALTQAPIGVYWNQPPVTFFLNKYLETQGLTLSEVELIELEAEGLTDNFIAGRFQSIVTYDPPALQAEREGNGEVVATTATYPGCMPEGFAMLADVLQEIPQDDLVKIFRGWALAVEWLKDDANWAEYQDILNAETFKSEDPYSEADLLEMLAGVKIHERSVLKARNQDAGGLLVWLQELKMMLQKNDMLAVDFIPENMLNNQAVLNALD